MPGREGLRPGLESEAVLGPHEAVALVRERGSVTDRRFASRAATLWSDSACFTRGRWRPARSGGAPGSRRPGEPASAHASGPAPPRCPDRRSPGSPARGTPPVRGARLADPDEPGRAARNGRQVPVCPGDRPHRRAGSRLRRHSADRAEAARPGPGRGTGSRAPDRRSGFRRHRRPADVHRRPGPQGSLRPGRARSARRSGRAWPQAPRSRGRDGRPG